MTSMIGGIKVVVVLVLVEVRLESDFRSGGVTSMPVLMESS